MYSNFDKWSVIYCFFEILPQLLCFVLVIDVGPSGEGMLRRTTDVLHLAMLMSELVLLQKTIYVQLGELEGSLVHALFLSIVDVSCVRYLEKLLFYLVDWEGG